MPAWSVSWRVAMAQILCGNLSHRPANPAEDCKTAFGAHYHAVWIFMRFLYPTDEIRIASLCETS